MALRASSIVEVHLFVIFGRAKDTSVFIVEGPLALGLKLLHVGEWSLPSAMLSVEF